MPRVLTPVLVMGVIVACALIDALDPAPAATASAVARPTVPPTQAATESPAASTPSLRPAPSQAAEPVSTPAAALAALAAMAGATAPALEPALPSGPASASGPFAIRLADESDFVAQYRGYWCVGASLQMAQSIITGRRDGSRSSQRRLWRAARDRSPTSPYNGANPIGWTAMLNTLGLGPYRLVSRPDLDAALRTATRAMARTGKPVGLVVWAGHHAWVMTGFEATGDPERSGSRVTGVRVMDPLYPHRSKWGRAPMPDQLLSVEAVGRQFTRRHRPDYPLGVPSGWLLIVPEG